MATLDYDKIINGIRKALYGYEVREYLAQSMEWTKAFVTQSVVQIKDYLRQAEAARDAAKASQDAAKVSETNAKASENAAKASQNAAASSASAAASSASAAKTSETNAKASEDEARQLVEEAKKVVNTDKTLTIDGAPADAKTVGDKFKSIKIDWNSVTDKPETFPPSAHTHSYAGSASAGGDATRALGVKDYAGSQTIEIGYATAGLTTSNLTHIAGYTENGTKIKDVSKDVLKSWLGVSNPYPVGSIYISTRSTSPASLFGGTWESIASERVLMGVSSSHGAGSTVSAGLPNITGVLKDLLVSGHFNQSTGAFKRSSASGFSEKTDRSDWLGWADAQFYASDSNSIYGNSSTVQPAAYYVYMWRRTA